MLVGTVPWFTAFPASGASKVTSELCAITDVADSRARAATESRAVVRRAFSSQNARFIMNPFRARVLSWTLNKKIAGCYAARRVAASRSKNTHEGESDCTEQNA